LKKISEAGSIYRKENLRVIFLRKKYFLRKYLHGKSTLKPFTRD
jgi:hypothetical protein